MNPLDRNHDGKVNLSDLSGRQNTTALDRNGDGINDLTGRPVAGQPGMAHHNPLDRNHDGRVDLGDLTGRQNGLAGQGLVGQGLAPGMMQTTTSTTTTGLATGVAQPYVQSNQRASLGLVRAEPTVIETIQKDVVIQERIHPVQKEEIQPIIYREREQLDVKQVTQMMHETQIQPTIIQQRELPAERREAIIERGAPIAENYVASSREVDATMRTQVVHAPIVNEVIKKTIIEEIQPVLERDVYQSTVIQNTQPIYEKVVEAPNVYREIVTVQDRGLVGGDLAALEAQGFNLGATGRRLSQGYSAAPLGMMGQPGMVGQPGIVGHHNPLDRNHDGRVDMNDLTGRQPGMIGQQGLVGQPGMAHHNPLDRNYDGRVNAADLTGRQPGMVGQNGLAGEPLMSNRGLTSTNPLDRNHDGKVDLHDLTGRPATTTANRPVNLL